MADKSKKEATVVLQKAQQLFYKKLAEGLSTEERRAINAKVKEELGESPDLGKEITKAVFNYVCPETGALGNAIGFNAHGNLNPDTGDTEAIVTIECKSCGQEHPVMAISFSEMLSMPFIEE
jgi:hypothetical protein